MDETKNKPDPIQPPQLNGAIVVEAEPVRRKRRIPRLVLILVGLPLGLCLLAVAIFLISRTVGIHNFEREYAAAVDKCGGQPIIKVYAHGWKTNRTEIITPENPSYDRSVSENKSYLGNQIIEYDIQSYYCSLDEAGINPSDGSSGGIEFDTSANLNDEHQKQLAKQRIEDYQLANTLILMQPTFIPAILSVDELNVLGSNYDTLLPYEIVYQTSDGKRVEYGCGYSQGDGFSPVYNRRYKENLNTDDTSYKDKYRIVDLIYANNGSEFQMWVTMFEWHIDNKGLATVSCQLLDYDSVLSRDDGKRMITEFQELDVGSSFDKVRYSN